MNDVAAFWLPTNFNSFMSSSDASRVPQTVIRRTDHKTYPSGSAVNPGYAYGTFIPLQDRGAGLQRFMMPYTIPMFATRYNTVAPYWKNNVQWINPQRSMRLKGLTNVVPGIDTSQLDAIQTYLGNAQG